MPARTRRSAEDRAEARRRARLAAREYESDADDASGDEDESGEAAEPSPPRPGGILTRLFPPAPPLPNRPDPLAGFSYAGPGRGVVAGLYLLARHPLPWIALGVIWGLGRLLTVPSALGLLASLVSFAALIAAGWLGWQRPWLFGLMASIIGMVVYAGAAAAIFAGQPQAQGRSATDIFVSLIYVETLGFQPLFGVVAGWYGGYLRRRMAATGGASRRRSGSRRR